MAVFCVTLYGCGQGRNQLFIAGEAIFMKYHLMTLFNRDTTSSKTVADKVLFATFPKMRSFQF